jgi:exopolyphosphatase/guanosine-5'-triphosphate,3'-diphosphate pyrophosphatase
MPSFAAIDIGSNASRLVIAEADDANTMRVVETHRIPVRMGHGVFLTGQLDPAAIDECVSALKTFKSVLGQREVTTLRAVVTASARDAVNSEDLLFRARDEAGITLEAISGTEEARLVKLAVESKLNLGGYRSLLVDLGGGSLELSEVHHDEVRFSISLEIGTVRLLESFLTPKKPVSEDQERLLNEYVDRMLAPADEVFRRRSYDIVAGTGGNFETVAQLAGIAGRENATIDVRAAGALLQRMKKLTPDERRAAYDLKADRADVIVPALFVILRVADLARTEEIVAPGVGLKEGILVELVDRHFRVWDHAADAQTVARAAVHLGRRYNFDEPHGTQVDRLSCMLFDQMLALHELGPADRHILRAAALLHDVGEFIASGSHHKHTEYIIENSDLMGLSPEQRTVVACVARYHRRASPSPKHTLFGKLSPADKKRVKKLASILRIADALDRGHRSKVRHLDITMAGPEIAITPKGASDVALEVWTARRKAELFEEVFDKKLRFELPSQ